MDTLCGKAERESEENSVPTNVGGFLTGDRAMSDKPDTDQSPVRTSPLSGQSQVRTDQKKRWGLLCNNKKKRNFVAALIRIL